MRWKQLPWFHLYCHNFVAELQWACEKGQATCQTRCKISHTKIPMSLTISWDDSWRMELKFSIVAQTPDRAQDWWQCCVISHTRLQEVSEYVALQWLWKGKLTYIHVPWRSGEQNHEASSDERPHMLLWNHQHLESHFPISQYCPLLPYRVTISISKISKYGYMTCPPYSIPCQYQCSCLSKTVFLNISLQVGCISWLCMLPVVEF